MTSRSDSTFVARIVAGPRLKVEDRAGFLAHLETLIDQPVDVMVKRHRAKRSLDQNGWLWGVAIPAIAEHCGYDAHEHQALHYELLAKRFGTKAVQSRLPGAPPLVVPVVGSSELKTDEFSDYMEWLVRFAATELGVVIPLPSERQQAADRQPGEDDE